MTKRSKRELMKIGDQTKSQFNSEESFWWMELVAQPNIWTNVNIIRFLRLYETYPMLWDPMNSKYSKASERSRAFAEISKKLNLQGVHEKECLMLIDSLRKIYSKEKKKREKAKSYMHRYKPSPAWFHVLNEIVEHVINNKKKETSNNKINDEKLAKLINCHPTDQIENIWTPKYFKTNLWKLFVPKTASYSTKDKQKNIKETKNICDKNIHTSEIESCEALKKFTDGKEKYCPEYTNILCDCSSHSINNIKKYCPEFKSVVCSCSLYSIQNDKTYSPELKTVSSHCSSHFFHNIKKYCPEFKNSLCDCSSQSSEKIKKYCPEFKNILCDCSSQYSSQDVEKYCLEFENILCDCPSNTKYCPENKDVLCDCSSKTSSDSETTENRDCGLIMRNAETSFNLTMPMPYKKQNDDPRIAELDRYCYYEDWNNCYKFKVCDSNEKCNESVKPEKEPYLIVSNIRPPRLHKNNTILETDISIFSDLQPHNQVQIYDCMEHGNINSLLFVK